MDSRNSLTRRRGGAKKNKNSLGVFASLCEIEGSREGAEAQRRTKRKALASLRLCVRSMFTRRRGGAKKNKTKIALASLRLGVRSMFTRRRGGAKKNKNSLGVFASLREINVHAKARRSAYLGDSLGLAVKPSCLDPGRAVAYDGACWMNRIPAAGVWARRIANTG